jgi:hypothetical protein
MSAERNYSAFDRKRLAAYYPVIHFTPIIDGCQVILITDHIPLVQKFLSHRDPKTPRQQRHNSTISEFITKVQCIKGADNVVAHVLSRGIHSLELLYLDLESIATAQEINSIKNTLTAFPLC